jgi:alpha-D-ribose 1-methylphosphonate 5-triphosphate synthase subunit PhnL
MTLTSLVELKLAARRARDESDVVELMRANPEQVDAVRQHLSGVHSSYVRVFDVLVQRARDQADA